MGDLGTSLSVLSEDDVEALDSDSDEGEEFEEDFVSCTDVDLALSSPVLRALFWLLCSSHIREVCRDRRLLLDDALTRLVHGGVLAIELEQLELPVRGCRNTAPVSSKHEADLLGFTGSRSDTVFAVLEI